MEKSTSRRQKMSKKLEKLNSNYRSISSMLAIAVFFFLTVLTISTIFIGQGVAFKNSSAEVTIICSYEGTKIPNVELTLYTHENGIPIDQAESYQLDENGEIFLILSPGEYAIEASKSGETGFHGYKKFTVGTSFQQKNYEIVVDMRPNSDHSSSIDLTPTYENMMYEEGITPVNVINAVSGENCVPIFLKNQFLLEKDDWTRVDFEKLSTPTKEILMDMEKKIQTKNPNLKTENAIAVPSASDVILFNPWLMGIVDYELLYDVWHPIALIDSASGLTHSFDLSVYYNKKFTISAEIKYSGISASGSYSHEQTFTASFQSITVSGGSVATWRSEYRHVYQEGSLYAWVYIYPYPGYWAFVGEFQREFVDKWYILSYDRVNSAQLTETREDYLGTWMDSQEADVTMTDSTSYSGSIGVSVKRADIFGSVKISLTFSYGTIAHHHFDYNQPGSLWYLKFYAGRAFDINTYQYYAGGGGGCPVLSVYDGEQYIDEGLLDIHVEEGGEDVTLEHQLINPPEPVKHKYVFRLMEHQKTHSYIDLVQLWATLENGDKIKLPLVFAVHSEDGNVKHELLLSDDVKTDIIGADFKEGSSEYIDLAFVALSNLKIVGVTFIIEGHNYIVK